MYMKFVEQKSKKMVASQVKVAEIFVDRAIGLMFKDGLHGYDGLLISPCRSIHTFFMRIDIDVIFLNKDYKIIRLIRSMKPWRMTRAYFKATQVLEMESGSVSNELKEGDHLEVVCLD